MRLDQPAERRAWERLGETIDHRLLENLGRTLGVIFDDTLPESKEAFGEIASFFGAHLGK